MNNTIEVRLLNTNGITVRVFNYCPGAFQFTLLDLPASFVMTV